MLYANVTFIGKDGKEDKGILFINNVHSIYKGNDGAHVGVGDGSSYHIKETPEEILKKIKKLEV